MNHILQEDARDILKQDISWEKFDGKYIGNGSRWYAGKLHQQDDPSVERDFWK